MVFSPRVVGAHRPDYHSIESVLSFGQFAGKTGEALVLALYDFFTDTEDGTYHFWPVDEMQGQPRIRRYVSDPIKLFNCYGWHICGQSSVIQYALYYTAGLKARQFSIPAHVLCEVYYDDAWHVLDVDMWTWFRNQQGQIASAFELAQDAHALIVENNNKSQPCNLPDRSLEDYANTYAKAQTQNGHVKDIFPHWLVTAHQMDFYLRPGESLTISEQARGAFILPDDWKDSIKNNGKEWHGYPRERFEPFRSYGNGEWSYQPCLSKASSDLEHAIWSQAGVQQTDDGIIGAGTISFRLQSPYVFAAKPRVVQDVVQYVDGAQLRVRGTGAITVKLLLEEKAVSLASLDGDFDQVLDLTADLTARYEAILQFKLAPGALLAEFAFAAPIMTAPKTLPRLERGENVLQVCTADKCQRKTIPWKHIIDFTPHGDPLLASTQATNAVLDAWAQGWRCIAPADASKPVDVVFEVEAPGQHCFSWFHAIAAVKEASEGANDKMAQLSWSADGKVWHVIKRSALSATHLQWDMSLEGDVVLDATLENVFLRIESDTAITGLEFYGHLDARAFPVHPLIVEHAWQEGQTSCHKQFVDVDQYVLSCGASPSQHSITFSVQSDH